MRYYLPTSQAIPYLLALSNMTGGGLVGDQHRDRQRWRRKGSAADTVCSVTYDHTTTYFREVASLAERTNLDQIDELASALADVRGRGGRLFVLGVGGGAGHASHAVNDFRKLCGIESYAPTDNVSELTARTNDDGWDTSLVNWLGVSRIGPSDAVFVFSVGGGSREHGVSVNLVNAIEGAKEVGASIFGVVGSPGGTLAEVADIAVIIDAPGSMRTPLVESFQAVVWHALVSHPALAVKAGHWENVLAEK
jgi:D-sedoheptulose 7-phosphate isomerase